HQHADRPETEDPEKDPPADGRAVHTSQATTAPTPFPVASPPFSARSTGIYPHQRAENEGVPAADQARAMDDRQAMDLAASQWSLITREQLLATGLSRNQIEHRLRCGVWIPVHDGVYRHRAATPSHSQRLVAAILAVGPLAAISHRAAADRHGIWSTQ